MSCWHIEFLPTPPISPMSFWVHRPVDARRGRRWEDASSYEPPRERAIPGRGYPLFHVSCSDLALRFASLAEIEACASIIGRKLLPRALDLVRSSGFAKGPHAHWLSRLPARWKRWSRRERLAARLRVALVDFRSQLEQRRSLGSQAQRTSARDSALRRPAPPGEAAWRPPATSVTVAKTSRDEGTTIQDG